MNDRMHSRWGLGALLMLVLAGCSRAVQPSPASPVEADILSKLYGGRPTSCAKPMRYASMGLALADLNADGYVDMVVSNGGDVAPQELVVYYNKGAQAPGSFPELPDWSSRTREYHTNLAVGDINGDGWLDVAVAVGMDRKRDRGGGGVRVYFNQGGQLAVEPAYVTQDRYGTFSCALGDVDGDGDLELAVASLRETDGGQGPVRIYENRDGTLSPLPQWHSADEMMAGNLLFADVDRDGLLDLVVAASQVRVYFARMDAKARIRLEQLPAWRSEPEAPGLVPTHLDVGALGRDGGVGVVASYNDEPCPAGAEGCGPAHFTAYLPMEGRSPVWRSGSHGPGSGVLLANLDQDEPLELVASRWGSPGDTRGAPLFFYQDCSMSQACATPLGLHPAYETAEPAVVETLAAADLDNGALVEHVERFHIQQARAVVTLSQQLVQRITQVLRNGQPLGRDAYISIPGRNWVSFAERLRPGDKVEVRYLHSNALDIVSAHQDCHSDTCIYYRGTHMPTSAASTRRDIP